MNKQEQEDFALYRERINKQIDRLLTENLRLKVELKTAREDSMELSEKLCHMKRLGVAISKTHGTDSFFYKRLT